ncbi:MAG: hypothetical protein KY476_26330 [Planctomycetes bacterium]|nr:hypothetical protein [Planctomycetota bacterium]
MRVITQLIRHFWERRALEPPEVDYLVRHGFIRPRDLPGYKPPRPDEPLVFSTDLPLVDVEPPGPLELTEESLVRRTAPRRRFQPAKGMLSVGELVERLRAEYARRAVDLESLLALGSRFARCGDWSEAAVELRQLPLETFYEGLCAGLRTGDVLFGDLWQAVDPEPFHSLIANEEIRGRAARSFAALLIAEDMAELGRYGWILKHDEAKALVNLRVLHRRLLEVLRRLYDDDRGLLAQAMGRNCDRVQFWALVLVYNARRDRGLGETPDYGREYGPLALPGRGQWLQAWACALRMDSRPATRLLVDCYGDEMLEGDEETHLCERPMMCPVGWHEPA